jgi:hypothetical protein
MSVQLAEGDLRISFTDAVSGFVFDQMERGHPDYHGVGQMHRVDFIVEFEEAFVFVEVKDPGHPKAQAKGLAKFNAELNDGTLSSTFASKFMESLVYRWAENAVNKPVHYLSLITLEAPLLVNLADEIARKLPPQGRPVPRWHRSILEGFQLLNLETWNAEFPKWPVTRLSAEAASAPASAA